MYFKKIVGKKTIKYFDIKRLSEAPLSVKIKTFQILSLDPAACSAEIAKYIQKEAGISLFVEKDLTRELKNTDIKGIKYEDIIFPADSVEICFEDRTIPTVIMTKSLITPSMVDYIFSKEDIKELIANNCIPNNYKEVELGNIKRQMFFLYDDIDGESIVLNLSPEEVSKWLRYNLNDMFINELDTDQQKTLRDLFGLIVKIFLYISLPFYTEKAPKGNIKHKLLDPNKNNRPDRPIKRVIYVPPVVNIADKEQKDSNGSTKTPHFRRGHFRMLRHEKYKEKGKLIYIRPIYVKGGKPTNKYIARKPK